LTQADSINGQYGHSNSRIRKNFEQLSYKSSNSLSVDILNDLFWSPVTKVMAKTSQHIWKATPQSFTNCVI